MADPMIEVRSVTKDFLLPHLRHTTVKSRVIHLFRKRQTKELHNTLRDIEFRIEHGEFFGVIGRNGCGKSTMLKILSGIYQPTRGTVVVNGRLVPFIELGVGFNHELTGRQNVYLNGALLGFSPTEVDGIYDDIVSFAELDGFMDQKLKNYSSGMQVRIAFSVATRARADILLIDEVLAVGDISFQEKCFDHFRTSRRPAPPSSSSRTTWTSCGSSATGPSSSRTGVSWPKATLTTWPISTTSSLRHTRTPNGQSDCERSPARTDGARRA